MRINAERLEFYTRLRFNPRTRDGCEVHHRHHEWRYLVSIHAPVMGANLYAVFSAALVCFNPRTRDGCERTPVNSLQWIAVSIHAPVMGANHWHRCKADDIKRFNPRTRDGCEDFVFKKSFPANVSIHAPVMGAKLTRGMTVFILMFQSTHP